MQTDERTYPVWHVKDLPLRCTGEYLEFKVVKLRPTSGGGDDAEPEWEPIAHNRQLRLLPGRRVRVGPLVWGVPASADPEVIDAEHDEPTLPRTESASAPRPPAPPASPATSQVIPPIAAAGGSGSDQLWPTGGLPDHAAYTSDRARMVLVANSTAPPALTADAAARTQQQQQQQQPRNPPPQYHQQQQQTARAPLMSSHAFYALLAQREAQFQAQAEAQQQQQQQQRSAAAGTGAGTAADAAAGAAAGPAAGPGAGPPCSSAAQRGARQAWSPSARPFRHTPVDACCSRAARDHSVS